VCVGNQQPTGCLCMYVSVRLCVYALMCVGNQRAPARMYVCVLVTNVRRRVCMCVRW